MGIIKTVRNLIAYGTPSLRPQVDPDVMRPLFENSVKGLSFYSPKDHLALWKTRRNDLRFQYSTGTWEQLPVWVYGVVHAQEPREGFGEVDVVSFMSVEMLKPDEQGEIFDAIKNIVNGAGIEKVVAASLGVDAKHAERLSEISGQRRFEDFEFGLGAFAHR